MLKIAITITITKLKIAMTIKTTKLMSNVEDSNNTWDEGATLFVLQIYMQSKFS